MSATTAIPGIERAEKLLAAAEAKRDAIAANMEAAQGRVAAARAQRREIIAAIAGGDNIARDGLHEADVEMLAAEREVAAVQEAQALASREIDVARGLREKAQRQAGNRAFIAAAKAHIALFEEADEMSRMLTDWILRVRESEANLHAAMRAAGRNHAEEHAALGQRHDLISFIPRQLQLIVVQNATAVNFSSADKVRATFNRAILDARQKIGGDE